MKLSKDILQKIRLLEIHTRRLLSGTHIGEHASAKKGIGLEFDQMREYQPGDDVRFIDWKASARANKMLVKEFFEERDRTIMLLVDQSLSTQYGSTEQLKADTIAEVAGTLALLTQYSKDKIGALLFSDKVHTVIPPKRGAKHTHRLIEQLFTHKKEGNACLEQACSYLMKVQKKGAIVFIISDFLDTNYATSIKMAGHKHDVVAMRCLDRYERVMPSLGTVPVTENKNHRFLSFSNAALQKQLTEHHEMVKKTLSRVGVEFFEITPSKPFMSDLIAFFRRRLLQ